MENLPTERISISTPAETFPFSQFLYESLSDILVHYSGFDEDGKFVLALCFVPAAEEPFQDRNAGEEGRSCAAFVIGILFESSKDHRFPVLYAHERLKIPGDIPGRRSGRDPLCKTGLFNTHFHGDLFVTRNNGGYHNGEVGRYSRIMFSDLWQGILYAYNCTLPFEIIFRFAYA